MGEETVKRVESALQGRKVDLLFIDGDRSYSSVRSHYGNYSRFVRKGGAVAFNHCYETNDVYEFFNELRGKKDISNNKNGIGLLFKE